MIEIRVSKLQSVVVKGQTIPCQAKHLKVMWEALKKQEREAFVIIGLVKF